MKDTRLSERELDAAVRLAYGGDAARRARKVQAQAVFRLLSRRPLDRSSDTA